MYQYVFLKRPTCLAYLHIYLTETIPFHPQDLSFYILSEWWGEMWPMNHRLWDTDYISDSWEQHSQHSLWPFNLEWQNVQFFEIFLKLWLNNQHLSHLCIFWLEVSVTKVPQYPHCCQESRRERVIIPLKVIDLELM